VPSKLAGLPAVLDDGDRALVGDETGELVIDCRVFAEMSDPSLACD
jgi:hypothetical protein